jgi:hypothetical protein
MDTIPPPTHTELVRLLAFALEHADVDDIRLAIRAAECAGEPIAGVLAQALAGARLHRSYLKAAFEWLARFGSADALETLADDPRDEIRYALPSALEEGRRIALQRHAGTLPADVRAFDARRARPVLDDAEQRAVRRIVRPGDMEAIELAEMLLRAPQRLDHLGEVSQLFPPVILPAGVALDLDVLLAAARRAGHVEPSAPFVDALLALGHDARVEATLLAWADEFADNRLIAGVLARHATPVCLARLVQWASVRPQAALPALLRRAPRTAVVDAALAAYRDDARVRSDGAALVATLCGSQAVAPLCDALADPLRAVRKGAARALALIGDPAVPALLPLLDGAEPAAELALGTLVAIGSRAAQPRLIALARAPGARMRRFAFEALGRVGEGKAVETLLIEYLTDRDPALQRAAADALCAMCASDAAIDALLAWPADDAGRARDLVVRLASRAVHGPRDGDVAVRALIACFAAWPALRDEAMGATDYGVAADTLEALIAAAAAVPPSPRADIAGAAWALAAWVRRVRTLPTGDEPQQGQQRDDRLHPPAPRGQQQQQQYQQQQQQQQNRKPSPRPPVAARFDPNYAVKAFGAYDAYGPMQRLHERLAEPPSSPEVPRLPPDACFFTATAPATVRPASSFLVDVWCHTESPDDFLQGRRDALEGTVARSVGPAAIEAGAVMTVHLDAPGFVAEPASATMLWRGSTGSVSFALQAAPEIERRDHIGTARVSIGGLPVASVHFRIRVGAQSAANRIDAVMRVDRWRKAFASYASNDGAQVLPQVRALEAAGFDVFVDVARLRLGEAWQRQLVEEIDQRDMLFLFWSRAAIASEYVDFEWRHALSRHGADAISPVPLETKDLAPWPAELEDKHFDHWTLHYVASPGAPARI